MKRDLPFDELHVQDVKKLRAVSHQESISIIEHFSNEIFYEIFDYLNGTEIYKIFFNLNYRFQQLLCSSSFLFKIKLSDRSLDEPLIGTYRQFICHIRHQISSLHSLTSQCNNLIILTLPIDSTFIRLESLVLDSIEADKLFRLLPKLASLPRLFSLTIGTDDTLNNLHCVYQLVFLLPKLKYVKCSISSSNDDQITMSLPLATSSQFSTIECLIIDYSCTFNDLFALISYTPQLRRLKFDHYSENDSTLNIVSAIRLSYLTSLSMYTYYVTFDEFEIFISKICSKLEILRLTNLSDDITYIDANRWEQFISQSLPELKEFHLNYYLHFDDDYDIPMYHDKPNQFASSFWMDRQWIFDAVIDFDEIIYSIHPYKKRWYDYGQERMLNSSIQRSKSMHLMFCHDPLEDLDLSIMHIDSVLILTEIYHLCIFENISIDRLYEILLPLLTIDSLELGSLSVSTSEHFTDRELLIYALVKENNQITKVNLDRMTDIEEIYLLMELCPHMIYLKVDCLNSMDVEVFVRNVLMKKFNHHHLQLLCFRIPETDDEITQKLEIMINSDELLVDYTMERILNNVYLQWK